MNFSTVVVLLIIALAASLAFRKVRKKGSCCGCSHASEGGCGGGCSCHTEAE